MLDPHTLLLFLTSALLLCLAPGPDNLFVLGQAMLQGPKAGYLVTLGLATGLIGHTAAVALGVAALFQASALAFTLLKVCGAAYLLYLAWGAWRAGVQGVKREQVQLSAQTLYRRGILMNLTNPKVSIFFLAFLPQFTQPEQGPLALQLLLLGGLFILCALLVFGLISLLAGRLGNWFARQPQAQSWMNRVAGTLFAGLALRLLVIER